MVKLLIYATLLTTIPYFVSSSSEEDVNDTKNKSVGLSRKVLYKYGFNIKRAEQIEGVKRITKMTDYSKKYAMVEILIKKLFKVFINAKSKVIEFGYVPGEEFPEKQNELDELAHVFENVALFGDLLLRCPDITHKLYDVNQEWKVAMNWGVIFSNETGVFDGPNETLLNLVAQELEIIPRDENYSNPYKEATIKAEQKRIKEKEEMKKNKKEAKKQKKQRKKKKGPRLGGNSNEL